MTTDTTTDARIRKSKDVFRLALLAGANITQAAEQAGVTRQTGSRWLRHPQLVEELQRQRVEFLANAGQRIACLQRMAVDTLEKHMQAADPKVSLQAVRTVLEWGDTFALRSNDYVVNIADTLNISPVPTPIDSVACPEPPKIAPRPIETAKHHHGAAPRPDASGEQAKVAEPANVPVEQAEPAAKKELTPEEEAEAEAWVAKFQKAFQADRAKIEHYKRSLKSGRLNAVLLWIALLGCVLAGVRVLGVQPRDSVMSASTSSAQEPESHSAPNAMQEGARPVMGQDVSGPECTGSTEPPSARARAFAGEDVESLQASQSVTKCNSVARPAGPEVGVPASAGEPWKIQQMPRC